MGIYIPGLKGNATVPGSAPIQPPQAFVDFSIANPSRTNTGEFVLTDASATDINSQTYFYDGVPSPIDTIEVICSGNALSVESVNDLLAHLAFLAANNIQWNNGTLDLSGGTNAAPTQQDANQTVAAGDSSFRAGAYRKNGTHNAKPYYNAAVDFDNPVVSSVSWSGTQWECYDTNGDLVYLSLDAVAFPWLATFISFPPIGIDPVPVFSGPVNADVLVLIAAGWTVTTN